MTAKPAFIAGLILGLLVAGIGQQWRLSAKLADLRTEHSEELGRINQAATDAANAAMERQQALQARLSDADTRHTQEKKDLQDENERLRGEYLAADASAKRERRLRVQAKCPVPAGGVPEAASPGSLGDGTTVELSDAAGQNIFDIRAGMIADRAKIKYLQDYARECRGE